MQPVVRDTTTWPVIFLELNADGSGVLSGTDVKYTCSGMFRSVLKTAWKSSNDWLVLGQKFTLPIHIGERAEVYTVRHQKLHPSYWYNNFAQLCHTVMILAQRCTWEYPIACLFDSLCKIVNWQPAYQICYCLLSSRQQCKMWNSCATRDHRLHHSRPKASQQSWP